MIAAAAAIEQINELYADETANGSFDFLSFQSIGELTAALKNILHYSHIIIDCDFFNCSNDELTNGIFSLKSANASPIIIIARGRPRGDLLLARLVTMGIYNFINAVEIETAREQAAACLAGRTEQEVQHFLLTSQNEKKKRNWFSSFSRSPALSSRKECAIGIAGVCPRIGTTTQALRLTRFLMQAGKSVCYVEANENHHVELISKVYSDAQRDDDLDVLHYNKLELAFSPSQRLSERYALRVFDCGTNTQGELFSACDIKIITAGTAAWEIAALAPLFVIPSQEDARLFLFSFTSVSERHELLNFMGERWQRTFFADFSPDMFAELTDAECELYNKLKKAGENIADFDKTL